VNENIINKLNATREMVEEVIMSAEWASKYDIKVLFYGSAVNGLLTNGASDVDLVVLICDKNTKELVHQDHKELLELVKK